MNDFIFIANRYLSRLDNYNWKYINTVNRNEYQGVCWGNDYLYVIVGLDNSIDRHLVELIMKKDGVNITKELLERYSLSTNSHYWIKENCDVEYDKACATLIGLLIIVLNKIEVDDSLRWNDLVDSAKGNNDPWIVMELNQADSAWINGDRNTARKIYEKWEGILNKLQQKRLISMRDRDKD